MKKAIKFIALALALVSVFAFAGCKKVKVQKVVVKDIKLTVEEYGMCFKKGENAELLAAANELIADLKASGELRQIIDSYSNETNDFTYTNPADSTGCLIVATNAEFAPFEYMDGTKYAGIDIKLASLLAEKVGKTLFIKNIDFDAIFIQVDAGLADVGIAGITINEERKQTYDFSENYFDDSSQVLVVREGDKLFANCVTKEDVENILKAQNKKFIVGVQNATTGFDYVSGSDDFEGFSNISVKSYENGVIAIQELKNGVIDAVVLDKLVAQTIAKSINND